MSRKIPIFLAACLIGFQASADEIALAEGHPQSYTVVRGDTLWDISSRFLADPWKWPDLWKSNPQIANPDLIYPGDVVALSYEEGRPVLEVVERNRNVKLSPEIRFVEHDDAIAPIPLDVIQPFLSRPQVVTADGLADSGYIVASQDDHLAFGSGFRVYARNLDEGRGSKFAILRQGDALVDPDSGEVLGYQAEHVGDAIAEKFGDPATVRITNAYNAVHTGDRLVPQEHEELTQFVPHAPAGPVQGKILAVVDGRSQISNYLIVVLNRGRNDGLEPGHVLAVFQEGAVVEDSIAGDIARRSADEARLSAAQNHPTAMGRMLQTVINDVRAADRALRDVVGTPLEGSDPVKVKLPEERAGELMVFRSFERVSYALVMNLQRPIHVEDSVRTP